MFFQRRHSKQIQPPIIVLPTHIKTIDVSPARIQNRQTRRKTYDKSFHLILRNILILAQVFGLLPIQGITKSTPEYVTFTWKSPIFFYCCIPFLANIFAISMLIYKMAATGSDLIVITVFIRHLCNMGIALALLHAAARWPPLIRRWYSIELHMQRHYGWPKKLELRVHVITLVLTATAGIDFTFKVVTNVMIAQRCSADAMRYYYEMFTFPFIFSMLPYNGVGAVLMQVFDFIVGFTWCFGDLFIMVMSSALAVRFEQISVRLRKVADEQRHLADEASRLLKEIRTDYNKLCVLCRCLDEALSYLVLMSYSTNLFFILIQLFNSLRNKNAKEKMYFFFSFGFLIARTIAVSLYAAWVNDESKKPILVLNSIPSHLYNLEIKRFVQQISFDSVALTGRQFFNVTRGLILSVAGAIVTYELVLIQFNENLLNGGGASFDENGCFIE